MNNATLARIHNYGSPAANIPPRPFLEPGIEHARDKIVAALIDGARETLDRMNPAVVETALKKAGALAAAQVQQEFTDNNWEPLKHPRSKKGRSHRKGAAIVEKPLIDTGALRASITYVVRKKGE
jgi:phage gpG-like protein